MTIVYIVLLAAFIDATPPSSHARSSAQLSGRAHRAFKLSKNCTGDVLRLGERARAPSKAPWLYETTLSYSCPDLFRGKQEAPAWPPPKWSELSSLQKKQFTLNGLVPTAPYYLQDRANGGAGQVWNASQVAEHVRHTRKGNCWSSTYNAEKPDICATLVTHRDQIENKRGLVLGSQLPWAEALLLGHGASHVTTVEYQSTKCVGDGPCKQMSIVHPSRVARDFLNSHNAGGGGRQEGAEQHSLPVAQHHPSKKKRLSALHGTAAGAAADESLISTSAAYDFAFSYSSYEHDGLGRYGDPVRPAADLESVQKVWCLLKPGGLFFLGLPVNSATDLLPYNAHRIYGPLRLPLLTANFEVAHVPSDLYSTFAKTASAFTQPLLVLRKPLAA